MPPRTLPSVSTTHSRPASGSSGSAADELAEAGVDEAREGLAEAVLEAVLLGVKIAEGLEGRVAGGGDPHR